MGNFIVYATPSVALIGWVLMLFPLFSPYPIKSSPLLVVKPAVSNMSNLPAAKFGLFGECSDTPPFAKFDFVSGSCIQPNAYSFPVCSSISVEGYSKGFGYLSNLGLTITFLAGLELLPNSTAKGIITPLRIELKIFLMISLGTAIFSFLYWLTIVVLEMSNVNYTWGATWFQIIPCVAFMFGRFPPRRPVSNHSFSLLLVQASYHLWVYTCCFARLVTTSICITRCDLEGYRQTTLSHPWATVFFVSDSKYPRLYSHPMLLSGMDWEWSTLSFHDYFMGASFGT